MYFISTLKGIVVIDTRLRSAGAPAPPVLLEQVLVDGTSYPVSRNSSGPDHAVKLSPNLDPAPLRIPPGQHRLELLYSAVSFDAPERVRFRYQLERLDSDWVDAGTRRTAFYSFVPPGNYRFRVTACNSDGIWNTDGPTLSLAVQPHFWQTWWFMGLAAAGLLGSVAGGARIVEKRKLQRRLKGLEQERLLERERTRIAQDLHDEMGAKLCRINFLSAHARRNSAVPHDMRQQIAAISDDSREVLQSLDEIVWAVNPQNDSLEHVASYIGQYAQNYFQETGIECALDIPSRVPPHPLSSQCRHHLFLAVHEAFTNILKHSGATRAKVTITYSPTLFEIIVADNGKGFVAPTAPALRSAPVGSVPLGSAPVGSAPALGLSSSPNTQLPEAPTSAARASSIAAPPDGRLRGESGNGLLNMSQRLASLGGQCHIESAPGQGAVIRFVFPFTQPPPGTSF